MLGCSFDSSVANDARDSGSGSGDAGDAVDSGTSDGSAPTAAIRINLNGLEHEGIEFVGTWAADLGGICDGSTYATGESMRNTEDDALFQTAYYGDFDCSVGTNLAPGNYEVSLLFAEIYRGIGCRDFWKSERVFDVLIEGALIFEDFDVVAEGDGCVASVFDNSSHPVRKSETVAVTDGTIDISFRSEDQAAVQAVEVVFQP